MFIGMLILVLLLSGMMMALEYLLKGKFIKALTCLMMVQLFFNIAASCGVEEIPAPEKPTCDYFLDGICVSAEEGINIDKELLSQSLAITERHVNSFYPGLNLAALSEKKGLSLHFSWDYDISNLRGIYTNHNTMARVFMRTNITNEQTVCMETYYVAMHEVLHFVAYRHTEYDHSNDAHSVPDLFIHWEHVQAADQDREPSYYNIAEGLIYLDIKEECMNL